MKLFSFRIFAISTFSFETGMSTRRCFAPHAFLILVSMSAIGAVMLMKSWTCRGERLPACLADARDETRQRQLAEADAAHAEGAEISPRPSAASAAVVFANSVLRLPLALLHHGFARHSYAPFVMMGFSSPLNGIPSSRSSANA